ncbi:thioredoxin-like protein AAED1 chloroplastic-like, partial [Trifolium medium]|nr:thioredoxin-like protein AAED1 chloroplastic-like [Trifolium medium]
LCRKRADYLASKKKNSFDSYKLLPYLKLLPSLLLIMLYQQDIMDASGVALVLIGPGNIDQAKAFAEQTKFKG